MAACGSKEEQQADADTPVWTRVDTALGTTTVEDLSIAGRWKVERPNGMDIGIIFFTAEGGYALAERRLEETVVIHRGIYRLDATSFPTAIQLIPDAGGVGRQESIITSGSLRFESADVIELSLNLVRDTIVNFEQYSDENRVILTRIY
jgi:hypothetical protein